MSTFNVLGQLSQIAKDALAKGTAVAVQPGAAVFDAAKTAAAIGMNTVEQLRALPRRGPTAGTAPMSVPPPASSRELTDLDGQIADLAARMAALKRWKLTLESADKTMAQRAGVANLTEAVRIWGRDDGDVYAYAMALLDDAKRKAENLNRLFDAGEAARPQDTDAYTSARIAALEKAASAEKYAQQIMSKIQDAWNKFANQGTPGIRDFALAPITGAAEAARAVADTATNAGQALTRAVGETAERTENVVKYAAYGLGAFALIYLLNFVPRPIRNGPRRSRTARAGGEASRRRRRTRR